MKEVDNMLNREELGKMRDQLEGWLDELDEMNYNEGKAKSEELKEVMEGIIKEYHKLNHIIDRM